MSEKVICGCCGSEVSAASGPIEIASDGLPVAVSMRPEIGLPLVDNDYPFYLRVYVDGKKVERCVAFDRRRGSAWRFVTMPGVDRVVIRNEQPLIERVDGVVTVERHETAA